MHELNNILIAAIRAFLNHVKNVNQNDMVKFFMMHENLDNPIQTPIVKWESMTPNYILDTIEKTIQSNKELAINEAMYLYLTVIKTTSGSGNNRIMNYLKKHPKAFTNMQNSDNLCLQKAIILAIAYYDYSTLPNSNEKNNKRTTYKTLTRKSKISKDNSNMSNQ